MVPRERVLDDPELEVAAVLVIGSSWTRLGWSADWRGEGKSPDVILRIDINNEHIIVYHNPAFGGGAIILPLSFSILSICLSAIVALLVGPAAYASIAYSAPLVAERDSSRCANQYIFICFSFLPVA